MDIAYFSDHGQSESVLRVVPMPPEGSCLIHVIDYFVHGLIQMILVFM